MISNTSICKIYLFNFVLSLFLILLNSLNFLNNEKRGKLKCFNISQKYLYIKNKKNLPGAFTSKGAPGPKPRAGPVPSNTSQALLCNRTSKLEEKKVKTQTQAKIPLQSENP